jgi:hypothetical protein
MTKDYKIWDYARPKYEAALDEYKQNPTNTTKAVLDHWVEEFRWESRVNKALDEQMKNAKEALERKKRRP